MKRRNPGPALFWFVAANVVLAFLNGYGFIRTAGVPVFSAGWWFAGAALFAQLGAFCLLLGGLSALLLLGGAASRALRWLAPLLFTLLHFLLYIDGVVYGMFRFHFNGMIWNVLTTPGGWESMHISNGTLALGGAVAAGVFVVEAVLFRLCEVAPTKKPGRLWAALAACVLMVGLGEHLTYAVCDLYSVRSITRLDQVVPFYQPLTVKKFAARFITLPPPAQPALSLKSGSRLRYPLEPLRFHAPAQRRNIIWIVLDGWRHDALGPQVTPNLWALAQKSVVFEDDLSGGNATRFGIFSMFYGLYSSYWDSFLNERRGPVLLDRLLDLGYRIKILSSTSLSFPEFRSTAFVRVPQDVGDDWPHEDPGERDADMYKAMHGFLAQPSTAPFFAFVFMDSTHAGYYFPKQFAKFNPYTDSLNYLTLGAKADPLPPFNRYKNAAYYSDYLVGGLLQDLEKRGLMDNTIIVVTGDHGEEFHEHGMWGHNGNFSDEEIHPALIVYWPGEKPRQVDRLTSHHDLVPTFMEALGVENPPSDYSLGQSLFSDKPEADAVCCTWGSCALIEPEATFVFGTASYKVSNVDAYDTHYNLIPDPKPAFARHSARLVELMRQMGKFLQ